MKTPTKLAKLTVKIDDRTPAHRDRAIDGLRAPALLAVPAGHWLLGGFTLDTGGGLHNVSPPATFGAPDTAGWILARPAWMPLFAGLIVAIAKFAQPLETPWDRTGTARRAAGFAYFALAV
jgi:hypothetical protein